MSPTDLTTRSATNGHRRPALAKAASALAVAALAGISATAPAHAAGWTGDSVVGGGFSIINTYFSFDAYSGASGADPTGTASFTNQGWIRAGSVTCLDVEGNAAVFGVRDARPGQPVVYRQFLVIDHGRPTAGGAGVDELREIATGWPDNRPCMDPTGLPGLGSVLKTGDITVTDN